MIRLKGRESKKLRAAPFRPPPYNYSIEYQAITCNDCSHNSVAVKQATMTEESICLDGVFAWWLYLYPHDRAWRIDMQDLPVQVPWPHDTHST